MYYLAYGMNTNLGGMSFRCPRAISLGKVILDDHKLRFRLHADAEYSPGSTMECALWIITEECERSLDMLEGYPNYYSKKVVKVEFNGGKIDAMIYYMNDHAYIAPPGQEYYNNVLQGYYQHGMSLDPVHMAYTETLNLEVIDLKEKHA